MTATWQEPALAEESDLKEMEPASHRYLKRMREDAYVARSREPGTCHFGRSVLDSPHDGQSKPDLQPGPALCAV